MAEVTAQMVRELRDATGAGMMDCKLALEETSGDLAKAKDWLRQKGITKAAERAGRSTRQGIVEAYIHQGGQVGVLVEVNSESDFVARNEVFQKLAREIALQIAGSSPRFVRREDVPSEEVRREKELAMAQARDQGKPEAMLEKIAEGKLNAFYREVCLLEQPYQRDPKMSVSELIAQAVSQLKENIVVSRFARFRVGEAVSSVPSPAATG
jgi:elongation factor Ts